MHAHLPMLLLLALCLGNLPLRAAAPDPLFDVKALTATPLNAQVLKRSVKDGIVTEEVRFHSEMDGDKRVDIFAFFCYPEGAKQLPAFIWNQAGLGMASPYFPELGAKRGYAALCIDYPIKGYRSTGGYSIGVEQTDDPRQNGIYHAAVALLKAVSYLQSRPEVDPDRIGMSGSSWGGFFTTLMAGIDPRLKAAAPMFGCGGMHLGNRWWDGGGWDAKRDAAYRERWRTTLDPAWRLSSSTVPIGWFTGTNDVFYWMPALMESHARAGGPKHLSLLPNWDHGLTPELDEQVFAFLDVYLQGKPPFIAVSDLRTITTAGKAVAQWTITPSPGRTVTGAELMLSYGESGNWAARQWITLPARIEGNRCTAALPATALTAFISGTVVDAQGFRYSTPLRRVTLQSLRLKTPNAKPEYDGCATWGGFEDEQLFMARAMGYGVPPLVKDARGGVQAARLAAGKTRLLPIYFAAGVPHRLTCALKSAVPAQVILRLTGTFDGKPLTAETTIAAGPQWSTATLDFHPPATLSNALTLEIEVPAGAEVLLDDVSFRPQAR